MAQRPERAWNLAVGGGLAWQPNTQDDHLSRIGSNAAASISARLTPSLALRVEGLSILFGESESHIHGPCLPGGGVAACHPPAGAVQLHGLTAGLTGGRIGHRAYVALGAGVYRLARYPVDQGDTRLGYYATWGRRVGTGLPFLLLEAQVHWVPGLTLGGAWSVPIRVGATF